MSRLQNLIRYAGEAHGDSRALHLEMALPYSYGKVAETIVVPQEFIATKLQYIAKTYNDELEMERNNEVKILKYFLK